MASSVQPLALAVAKTCSMYTGSSLAWLAPLRLAAAATTLPSIAKATEQQLVDVSMQSIVIYSYGLTNLNLLFEANPFFLNKDLFEIEDFIKLKEQDGLSIEEIVDLIDSNPYAIDEI